MRNNDTYRGIAGHKKWLSVAEQQSEVGVGGLDRRFGLVEFRKRRNLLDSCLHFLLSHVVWGACDVRILQASQPMSLGPIHPHQAGVCTTVGNVDVASPGGPDRLH
jgi:hypothetical protein